MNSLNTVVKTFHAVIKELKKDRNKNSNNDIHIRYYEIIMEYLLIEHKYQDIVKQSGKPIYHYFKYSLPDTTLGYFYYLYSVHHPVRFAVETFDSIEEIKNELKQKFEK
jgi:hypothetical protein